MTKITLYGTPTCPWCVKAKELMEQNDIGFEYVDVSSDDKGREDMIEKSGQMGVPVLDIDGEIVVGFDKDKILAAK